MWIRALADADASCGAKAAGLARLIAAGLPVPEGFVLERVAFSHVAALTEVSPDAIGHVLAEAEQRIAGAARSGNLHGDLVRAVQECAAALGRLAVRSSASIEDDALGSAAGVFASVTDVSPADVWDAVCAVWTSALTPLAVAYARRRATTVAIAVILQRFIAGPRVTVYTRPIGAPGGDEIWLSRGDQRDSPLERIARSAIADHREAAIALAAETAIGASQGADVELVLEATPGGMRPWVVQARPMIHPVRHVRSPPPPIVLAPLVADGRRWTWDIAHNPDPLSPAQAGLVDHVERAAVGPYAMRVCGGYLYTTPRGHRTVLVPPVNRAELTSRIAAIEARFVLGQAPTLDVAVERYVGFMRIWAGELSPLIAAARRCLPDRLARDGTPASEVAVRVAALVGPRRVLRDRVMSPAWDVAVPAFAERPEAASASDLREQPPLAAPVVPRELVDDVDLARAAADAAEHDDLWFARAQWMVRQALLARAAELQLRDDDIFWLPLDELLDLAAPRGSPENPDDAHRRASAARAASERAAGWDMPLVVDAHGTEPAGAEPRVMLRGVGEGPRIVGRVVRFGSLGEVKRAGRGDVVVTRAITPALAMLVDGCAALVSETGGLLDHGAALARELGIPCVVGCTDAWAQLTDGAVIFVDGNAGLVGLVSPEG